MFPREHTPFLQHLSTCLSLPPRAPLFCRLAPLHYCLSLKDYSVGGSCTRPVSFKANKSRRFGSARLCHPSAAISTSAEFDHTGESPTVGRTLGGLASALHSRHDQEIFHVLIPAAFTIALDPLLGAVDTAIVGRLGATALGAVGMSNMVFGFSLMCFKFLMVVTTPIVAAAVSQSNEKVSEATTDGLWVALCCGIPMMMLLWTFPHVILRSLKASPDAVPYCVSYLRARCPAVPIAMAMFVINATYRGLKDTRTPLASSLLANTVNLSLDLLLVFGVGMGVAGAAWATTASQYVSFIFLTSMLIARKLLIPRHLLKPPQWSRLMPLLKAGMLLTSQSFISTVLLMQSTSFAAQLGSQPLAAHEICRQAFALQYILFAALELTSQSLVASALGKGDRRTATSLVGRLATIGCLAGLGVASLLLLSSATLPAIFTTDATVQLLAQQIIPVVAMGSIFDALASAMEGCLQGASEYKWVSAQQTVGSLLCFLGLLTNLKLGGGLVGLWCSLRLISVARFSGSLIRLLSGQAAVQLRLGFTDRLEPSGPSSA